MPRKAPITQVRLDPATGQYVPDPDYYPTDLVRVQTVYGDWVRVRRAHLDGSDGRARTQLPCFTPQGRRYVGTKGNMGCGRYIHRGNIVTETNPLLEPVDDSNWPTV
jgi:hypothetical protein